MFILIVEYGLEDWSGHCEKSSTETVRLIRDGEKGGGVWRWAERDGDYVPIATLSPPE